MREARKLGLDAAIHAAGRRAAGPRVYRAFHQLLAAVQAKTPVLSPRSTATDLARRFVEAIFQIASRTCDWRRPLDAWTPPARASSHALVLASLGEHLFALFPVPRFMTSAWLGTREEQGWYLRLGAGESVRAIDFPIPLTRRMSHAFRSAPDDLSILGALRWAEVRGMGGSPELARAITRTRLGRETGDERYFAHVIAFLVDASRERELDHGTIEMLVEFFHDRRRLGTFRSLDGVWPAGTHPRADVAVCAVGPKTRENVLFSWGGRRVAARARPSGLTWNPAPFGGFRWFQLDPIDARHRTWRIAELRTSEALRQEGIAMRHCVATYAAKCAVGGSSIWSMTVEEQGLERRVVTIEVDVKRREVCQVKALANRRPKRRFVEVLRRWVEEQGLSMPGSP